ncbi:ribosome rescue GTPase HflX [Legionella geestiana]|uniref:ribosome rescue GTPase HflX n=1 Tax=Legionella geestiana TaxID=45065 RepID=UPI003CCC79EA
MTQNAPAVEQAILVQMALPDVDALSALAEFGELARSAGAVVVGTVTSQRVRPEAKYCIGEGKALEIQALMAETDANLVLVNHELSPSQTRNLERLLGARVIDRSGLILDIFARRARTFEGKLQVELAQLEHLSTRLVRGWTHLERQKGGIGLRGPGETQLETDRRLLRARIRVIRERLEKVRKSRDQNRRAREKAALPTVSLVGYTNAGKSTLFNALTGASTHAANQLFATLDPNMRSLELRGAGTVILADTVGFIRDLPHQLVAAFRATLEETVLADLLLHVIDASDANWREHVNAVNAVLTEAGAIDIPMILVFNKTDLREGWDIKSAPGDLPPKVWLSAKTGEGLDLLATLMSTALFGAAKEEEWVLAPEDARLRARLYALNAVLKESTTDEGGWRLLVRLSPAARERLLQVRPPA